MFNTTYPKKTNVIKNAAIIPTASANKPAGNAWRVLVTFIDPKYRANT